MRIEHIAFFLVLPMSAAVTVKSIQTTNTQAVIRYVAPTTSACTVEVSEESDYDPLVHDVNGTLFSGANSDSRTGAISYGRERVFVAGTRTLSLTSDDRYLSRSLAADTLHYFRIDCGGDTATGTFTTATIPTGVTRLESPYIPHPTIAGIALPSWRDLTTRGACEVDVHTGAKMCNATIPGDGASALNGDSAGVTNNANFSSTALGTNWTDPNNILADDATSTTYDGASCVAEVCDKLAITNNYGGDWLYGIDYFTFYLDGSGDDANAENRKVYACLVYGDQTTCEEQYSTIYEMTLPQTTAGSVSIGTSASGDTLRPHYVPGISAYEASSTGVNRKLRVLLWKKTGTGTISIDHAKFDIGTSPGLGTGDGGNPNRWSKVADGEGFYWLTAYRKGGGSMTALRVHSTTREIRYLGVIPGVSVPGVGNTNCSDENAGFQHPTIPNRFICSFGGYVYRLDYSGDGTNKSTRYNQQSGDWTVTQMLTDTAVPAAAKTFTETNSAHYPGGTFDDTKFTSCGFVGMQGTYYVMHCQRGGQNSYGWIVILNDSLSVVAARAPWQHQTSRWCPLHAMETVGDVNIHQFSTNVLAGNAVGQGPYTTTLAAAITTTGQTTITLTSDTPTSAYADTTLMPFLEGDVITIGSEHIRLGSVSGSGPYTYTGSTRGVGSTTASTYSNGATVTARCADQLGRVTALLPTWDYIDDPYGEDTTYTDLWANTYGGHQTSRKNKSVDNSSFGTVAEGTNIITVKNYSYQGSYPETPKFAGVDAWTPGLTYQTHPTNQNELETGQRSYFWTDVRPFIGGAAIAGTGASPAATLVGGYTKVYTYTRSLADPTGAPTFSDIIKYMPLYGAIGASGLTRDISGPGSVITDDDDYTTCYAMVANECVTGSSAGTMYVNVGPLTLAYKYCRGGETFAPGDVDICVFTANQQTASLMQGGAILDTTGRLNTRILAREGLNYTGRNMGSLLVSKPSPNGDVIIGRSFKRHEDNILIPNPRLVLDSRARNTWQRLKVDVGAVAGVDNVVVDFGYDTNFYCSENRSEKCIANAATVPTGAHPYRYPVEGTGGVESGLTGVSCSAGCSVELPLLPGRVAYYRVVYRNSGGTALHRGQTQVAAVN